MAEQPRGLPPIPDAPQQEGARWRFHRPTSEAVAAWFGTVPLDEGMSHTDYIGGVVLIPQTEKVKHQTERGTQERYEQVFTPYMQIGTRVGYARRLAEYRELIYRPRAAQVPRSTNPASPYFNGNMEEGLWWHVVMQDGVQVRYLCATWVVEFFEPQSYGRTVAGQEPIPVLSGTGTKQVGGGADANGLMKAQTGALGRALAVAGILVVGTGIASAEDMMEYATAPAPSPQLPPPSEIAAGEEPPPAANAAERLAQLRSRALAAQAQLQEDAPAAWQEFTAWWGQRAGQEGWRSLNDVPAEALEGIVARMASLYDEAAASNEPAAVSA